MKNIYQQKILFKYYIFYIIYSHNILPSLYTGNPFNNLGYTFFGKYFFLVQFIVPLSVFHMSKWHIM
uniref:Uncharacterized protein n=1 Tax=Anguilla anguilla TaxID=7936 RepID=A0A0E9X537_ANGAN